MTKKELAVTLINLNPEQRGLIDVNGEFVLLYTGENESEWVKCDPCDCWLDIWPVMSRVGVSVWTMPLGDGCVLSNDIAGFINSSGDGMHLESSNDDVTRMATICCIMFLEREIIKLNEHHNNLNSK